MPCGLRCHPGMYSDSEDSYHGFRRDAFTLPDAVSHYAPSYPLLPRHMDFRASFDLAKRSVDGSIIFTLQAMVDQAKKVEFDAVDFDEVKSVEGLDGAELEWEYDEKKIVVVMRQGVSRHKFVKVKIAWKVVDPLSGLVWGDKERWVVSDHETERARYWMPCCDHISVRTTVKFELECDDDLTALANGRFLEKKGRLTTWDMQQTVPSYLICVAVGDFVKAEGESFQGKPVASFGPAGLYSTDDLNRSFGKTCDMLRWITRKLNSELPWDKYYQVAVGGIGGAMENSSLVSWDAWSCVSDDKIIKERGWLIDNVIVHEMAHTWFGNSLVCCHFDSVWLKESFANFMELEWVSDNLGKDVLHYMLFLEREDYLEEASCYVRPLVTRRYDSSWSMFDRHLYPGGAWRLHMLRHYLTDEVFWSGIQSYVSSHIWTTVETSDFRKSMEKESNIALTKFFDQWIFGKGFPRLSASFTYNLEKKSASLTLKQKQKNESKGVGLFDLDVEVAFEVASEWTTRTISMTDSSAESKLEFACASRPTQIVIDPNAKILFSLEFEGSDDIIRRSATSAPTVAGRILALSILSRRPTKPNISALSRALSSDKFWGVRAAAAKFLSRTNNSAAIAALCESLETEKDPRVLILVLSGSARIRDPAVERALVKYLSRKETSSYSKYHALRGLGHQRGERHLELFQSILKPRDDKQRTPWHLWEERGAAVGLGETRSERAAEVALNLAKKESELPLPVKCSLIGSVQNAVTWAGRGRKMRMAEEISHFLRDSEYKVRLAAARAVCNLGRSGELIDVSRFLSRVVNQDVPMVKRMITGRAAGGFRDEKMEKMQQEYRELQDRVSVVETKLENLQKKGGAKPDKDKTESS